MPTWPSIEFWFVVTSRILKDTFFKYIISVLRQIQGPVMEQDLSALSDQIGNIKSRKINPQQLFIPSSRSSDNVARQMRDRRTSRDLLGISSSMRDLSVRKVKPLMKMQDELVYQLAILELQMQPLQRQVNQSLSHLKTIQYYINNQGEKIAQMACTFTKILVIMFLKVQNTFSLKNCEAYRKLSMLIFSQITV